MTTPRFEDAGYDGAVFSPDDPGEWCGPDVPRGRRRISPTPEECAFLSTLMLGRRVLEIGTGLGVSTVAIMRTARSVISIDPDPWVRDHVAPGFPSDHPSTFFWGYSEDFPGTPAGAIRFEAVFIDGNHDGDDPLRDLRIAQTLLVPHGLVVLHDHHLGDVAAACERGKTEMGFRYYVLPTRFQLTIGGFGL